jgi:hypothetical protein
MEIEFIEVEHRENVLKIMEICGVDMEEAYNLYTSTGYNFEVNTPLFRLPSIASLTQSSRTFPSSHPKTTIKIHSSLNRATARIPMTPPLFTKKMISNISSIRSSDEVESPSTESIRHRSRKAFSKVWVS